MDFKRILISLALIVFLITPVMAFEWDNVKVYNPDTNEITFSNTFLKMFNLGDIAIAKLDTPQINKVMPGNDRLVAKFSIDAYGNYNEFIKGIELIDLNTGKPINRDVNYKYNSPIEVIDYQDVCTESTSENKTGGYDLICEQKESGSHLQDNWIPLEKLDLKAEKITIGVFTDVLPGDNVEWYPTLFGMKVTEWAVWTDAFNIGLIQYYPLDNKANVITGINNASGFRGNPVYNNTDCLIGNCSHVKEANNFQMGTINFENNDISLNFWMKTSEVATTPMIWSRCGNADCTSYNSYFEWNNDGPPATIYAPVGLTGTIRNLPTGGVDTWVMVSYVVNSSGFGRLSTNGVERYTGIRGNPKDGAFNLTFGSWLYSNDMQKGQFDEIGIWNRTLSTSEISDLFNSGAGLTYQPTVSPAMSSIVSYPDNNINITSTNKLSVGCNFTSTVQNITSILLNVTNSSGIQSYANITTISALTYSYNATWITTNLTDGKYNFSCTGYGSSGINSTASGSNINILFHTNPSVIFFNQNPSDIDSTNSFGGVNVTYNITSPVGIPLNLTTITIYHKSNSTTRNIIDFVNGTNAIEWDSNQYDSNLSSNFLWNVEDDEVYPLTSNILPIVFHNTVHSAYSLNTDLDIIKIELLNVTNTTKYNFLEMMVNASVSADTLRFYYCNSSYVSGSIDISTSCAVAVSISPTPLFNLTSNSSMYKIIPLAINTTSGTLAGIKVTPKSYFAIRGTNPGGNRYVYYINNPSREGATQTSVNSGIIWTNQTYSVDASLHQFSGNDSFYYYVCANDTNMNTNCSSTRQDLMDLAGLPPTPPIVYNPINLTYDGIVNINYTASLSPNGYDINNYNITLWNSEGTFNQTIRTFNLLNLSYAWNSSSIKSGSFFIKVEVNDSQDQKNIGQSSIFSLDNIAPNVTLISPENNTYSNNNSQIFITNLNDYGTNCYQESTYNQSQNITDGSCNQNYSGNYSGEVFQQVDGNWGTRADVTFSDVIITYIKPTLNNSVSANWKIGFGTSAAYDNYTEVLPYSCFNNYNNKILLRVTGYTDGGISGSNFSCYNGTWKVLANIGTDGFNAYLWEEAITWNIAGTGLSNATLTINNQSGLYNQTTISFLPGIFSYVWQVPAYLLQGLYSWSVVAYDNVGNVATSVFRSLGIITSNPTMSIVYPLAQNYTIQVSELNYTTGTQIPVPTNCWYSLNGGINNITITCGNNVTGLSASQGLNTWKVYIEDNATNINQSSVTFFVDSINPSIQYGVNTEINDTFIPRGNIVVNVTSGDTNFANLTINLYNGTNMLISSQVSNLNSFQYNFTNLINGTYYFNATALDVYGNSNTTETRTVTVHTGSPIINIISPIGNQGTVNLPYNVTLNITILEQFIDTCIYYLDNGTGTVFNCSNSVMIGISDINYHNITVFVNNSVNTNSTAFTTFWTAGTVTSFNYNDTGLETANESIGITVSSPTTLISAFGTLNYNNVQYNSIGTCSGLICNITSVIDLPLTSIPRNYTFNFTYRLYDGTTVFNGTSISQNQFVSPINITQCNTNPVLNFTSYDEQNNSNRFNPYAFDGTFDYWIGSGSIYKTINITNQNAAEISLCAIQNNTFYANAIISYTNNNSNSYLPRNYFYQRHPINKNYPENISLLSLKTINSLYYTIKVQDISQQPLDNVLVEILRYNPGFNKYTIAEIVKTNAQGQTVANLEGNLAFYSINITKDNKLIENIPAQKAVISTAPYTLTITIGQPYISPISPFVLPDGLNNSVEYNKTSGVVAFTYIDNTNTVTLAELYVYNSTPGNSTKQLECYSSSTLPSGILSCQVNVTGSYYTQSFLTYQNSSKVLIDSFNLSFSSVVEILFDNYGLFLGLLILLVCAFVFKFSEVAGVWAINLGVIACQMLHLINFGWTFITSTLLIAIIITAILER